MNMENVLEVLSLVGEATWQTLIMVFLSLVFSTLIGFPLGILLSFTRPGNIMSKPLLNSIIGKIVNVLRAFPFLILIILLLPLTRLILGTAIGTSATIVPLSIAAAPFVARVIETAINEVNPELVLAATAMGSTNFQIIRKVLIPEAMPSLVDGITLTIINLIGYSAMAGTIGGGGLGDLAIRYGYQRFRIDVLVVAVIVILIMVELIQFVGSRISRKLLARR